MSKVTEVKVPRYDVSKKIDYKKIGEKLDSHIKEEYSGEVLLRAISISEHDKPLDEVVNDILKHGTDRTNPKIKGRKYNSPDEIYAGRHNLDKQEKITPIYVQKFYEKPVEKGADPMKIDLILVYDPEHFEHDLEKPTRHTFKNTKEKKRALKGIIKVTS